MLNRYGCPLRLSLQISRKGGVATGRIEPKTLVYFRHAATNANQVDADKLDFARCETQRNLSGDGRRMARDIGVAFKALGIRVDKVVSSPYCWTVETAQFAFGRNEVSPVLFRPGAGGFVYVGDVTAEEWVRVVGAAAAR